MLRWIFPLCLALNPPPSGLVAAESAISISGNQTGNVFFGNQGRLAVNVTVGSGHVEVEDDSGTIIAQAACRAGVPLAIPLPAPGFYRIRVEAGDSRATSTALVLDADGAFDTPAPAITGGPRGRTGLDLSQVQTTAGGFAWDAVPEADAAWLTEPAGSAPSIVCLGRLPDAWTTKPSPAAPAERDLAYPPRDWRLTAAMLTWVIASLPPTVDAIEVIDRPERCWRGSDEDLVRYHRLVADAVHTRPHLVVLGPGSGDVNHEQITRLDRLDLFDHLDGIAVHPPDRDGIPEGDFISRIDTLRLWNATRRRPLPIYLTDVASQIATLPAGATCEQAQARSRARIHLLLAARPDVVACYLAAVDPGAVDPGANHPSLADAYAANAQRQLRWATHIRLLDLGGDTHALVWTTANLSRLALWTGHTTATLHLPMPVSAAWNACGRQLTPPGATVLISPNPRYLRFDDAHLATATTTLPPLVVPAGTSAKLPFSAVLAAAALLEATPSGAWLVRADAPRGDWQIIGRTATGWVVQPLTVAAPMVATGAVVWNQGQPQWNATLTSRLAQPATVTVTLKIKGDEVPRMRTTSVPMGGTASIDLPLAELPWGQCLQGTLDLAVTGAAVTWHGQQPFTATLAALVARRADDPAMSRVPVMDISAWGPFTGGGQAVAAPPPGLRARVRLAHDVAGIHLLAEVDDPLHHQDQTPADMWRQDSLQVAFDVDADQPWQPDARSYWNGHRVVEYHLALAADGPRCWRAWAANGLPGHTSEPRVSARIERRTGTTCYRLIFPWAVLGLDMPLPAGRKLGMAIAVNTSDDDADERTGLRLFSGIVEAKDATNFGVLPLLP